MTKEETIIAVCAIVGLAYRARGDFSKASDCFCGMNKFPFDRYENAGEAVDFVEEAVKEKIVREFGEERLEDAMFFRHKGGVR